MPNRNYSVVSKNLTVTYSTMRVYRNRTAVNPLYRTGVLPSRTVKTAVNDVSFAVSPGESVGIVGRNGSGKSTLLRTISGLESKTAGEVWAKQKPIFMGVSPALVGDRTGIENIYLGCLAMGMKPRQTTTLIPEIEALADLGSAINDPINTYSSGMGSRLRFAISTAAPTSDILMIDEALGTGDAAFQERSEEALKSVLEKAGTIFLVSHAPKTIEKLCTRALWLVDGEVVMDGESAEVSEAYRWWSWNLNKGRSEKANRMLNKHRSSYQKPEIQAIG